ncbi:cytochrome c domain-containing protein, partial [Haematococcus lacustris]
MKVFMEGGGVGCHAGGGNVLAAGASLFPDDLKRNGYTDAQSLYTLIYKGKGKMPGYGKECAPKAG